MCSAQARAAWRSFSLIAVAIGLHDLSSRQKSKQRMRSVSKVLASIDAMLEHVVLLLEIEVGVELVAVSALL